MKICIAGKNDIAVNGTKYLLDDLKIDNDDILVLPNKNDIGIDTWQKSLKKFAIDNQIRILDLYSLYNIKDLIFISLEYDTIIKTELFESTRLYNIHFSKLPSYKGMFTSVWPIINGEKKSGVTLHRIDNGIDTGDIIDSIEFNIDINWTSRDLYYKYLEKAFELFKRNIFNIINDNITSKEQSAIGSTYYSNKSIDYRNIVINLDKTGFEIYNQIRAFIFKEYQLPTICGNKIESVKLCEYKLNQIEKVLVVDKKMYIKGIDGYGVVAFIYDNKDVEND